jgi:hypothetical protein
MQNGITPIGISNWRNNRTRFGIKDKDRLGHLYVIGKTGVGKSTLLANMAISDIQRGNGCCILDPHGDIAQKILDYIPKERMKDVIYFNPADIEHPIAFNPLHAIHPDHHHLVASGMVSTFKKIWIDSWGPRLEHILRFTILALLEYPHATLLDIQPMLTDASTRKIILEYVKNPATRAFWYNEFDKYTPAFRAEAISPIVNKVGLFASCLPLRNIVGQQTKGFRMSQVLDEKRILIVNLSKGLIGEDASTFIGSMLVTSIQLATMFRAKQEEHTRIPFYLYVDEAHSFISLSFADMLSEARKYGLSLFLAHQFIEQMHEKIRSAIFGNVGTMVTFRVGSTDAQVLAKEFHPVFNESDLVNLPKYEMYMKLMIDGATSKPFSAETISITTAQFFLGKEVVQLSRSNYAKHRHEVEKEIGKRHDVFNSEITQDKLF